MALNKILLAYALNRGVIDIYVRCHFHVPPYPRSLRIDPVGKSPAKV